jgi:hypothetical protein
MNMHVPALISGALPVARPQPAFIGKNLQGKLSATVTHRKFSV